MAERDLQRPWAAPILRWAGSKRKLLPKLLRCVPSKFQRYVEPFAGSACFFFALRPSSAILGDINGDLIHAYNIVHRHPRIVARRVCSLAATKRVYYKVRQTPLSQLNPIDRAVHFIYLNRHCFNGVYRTNRKGQFNVPIGVHTGAVPSEAAFYRCSVALRSANLVACDFEACLTAVRNGDFVYLDPPYSNSPRPKYGEYGYDTFQPPDLGRLTEQLIRLNSIGAKFLLSYAESTEDENALSGWEIRRIKVRRHVAGFSSCRRIVGEVLVANFEIPEDL